MEVSGACCNFRGPGASNQVVGYLRSIIAPHREVLMKRLIPLALFGVVLTAGAASAGETTVVKVVVDQPCPPVRCWVPPVYEHKQVQVWVDAVYRTVPQQTWVPPVYRTVYEKVCRPAVTQTVVERVWIPERWETHTVVRCEGGTTYTTRERVLVCPGRFESRSTEMVVTPARTETIERQELVSPGHYRQELKQELVAPGHFEYRTERVVVRPGYYEVATR